MSIISYNSIPSTLNLPTIAPSAIFDFEKGLVLDPRIQLSRNSAVSSRINKLGILETIPANMPRFNYVDGISKGLLLEAGATNLFTNSEAFTSGIGTTVESNNTISPNKEMVADILVEAAVDAEHYATDRNIPVTISDIVFYGISIKQIQTTNNRKFYLRLATGVDAGLIFDFQTKTSTLVGAATSGSYTELGNGWFFVWLTTVVVNTASMTVRAQILKTNSTAVYLGDINEKIAIWGGQFYKSPLKMFSYIPTGASSVTRPDELAIIPQSNIDFISLSEFSVFVKFTAQTIGTAHIITFHDTTAFNRIYLYSIDGVISLRIITGGTVQCNLVLGTLISNIDYKIAFRIKTNDCAVSISGNSSIIGTSVTIPTVTDINIGSGYGNTNILNSTIAKITFYTAALTNSNLEALSL